MCITIDLKAKTASVIFLLFCCTGVTWYNNKMITQTNQASDIQAHVECDIVETSKIDSIYHTNWEYIYNNQTYTFTDESTLEPYNHECCIVIDSPFDTIECVSSTDDYYLYMIIFWLFTFVYVICACCICREQKTVYINNSV